MKSAVSLQLVTVGLENGKTGVFIGVPLVLEDYTDNDSQVEQIWFSDVQEVPEDMAISKLIDLVREQYCQQYCQCNDKLH